MTARTDFAAKIISLSLLLPSFNILNSKNLTGEYPDES
jgi:hypothetical protein